MEAHITFYGTLIDATAKAGEFQAAGLQVALAGPVGDTFIRPGQDDTDLVLTGER